MASSEYNNAHKTFLQAIMNKGIINKSDELKKFNFGDNVDEYIRAINEKIHGFHFKIKEAKREDTGDDVFVLVSLAENDLNRLVIGADFSRQEVEMFKKILELVVYADHEEYVGMASTIDVLNLADAIAPKISKTEAKRILDQFVEEQWFYLNNGMVTLSPRTILELENYITEEFKDFIYICKICNMMVFHGMSCSNCSERMHNFCAERYFLRVNQDVGKCLTCGSPWTSNLHTQVTASVSAERRSHQ